MEDFIACVTPLFVVGAFVWLFVGIILTANDYSMWPVKPLTISTEITLSAQWWFFVAFCWFFSPILFINSWAIVLVIIFHVLSLVYGVLMHTALGWLHEESAFHVPAKNIFALHWQLWKFLYTDLKKIEV